MEANTKSLLPHPALPTTRPFSPQEQAFWDSLPSSPGIYIFADADKKPLYIGKSIDIKSRIKQHFENQNAPDSKSGHFIPKTIFLTTQTVNNDLEALILETNYIKSFSPRYNSLAKDDKSSTFIVFTNQPTTKITLAHTTDLRDFDLDDFSNQVYGPYPNSSTARSLLRHLRRTFGYCQSPFNSANRPCFYHHLHQCPGTCTGEQAPSEYQKHLGKLKSFLSGRFVALEKTFLSEIKKFSKNHEFESAEKSRRQLENLRNALQMSHSAHFLKLGAISGLSEKIISTLNHPLLKNPPYRIECYDLAHHMGDSYVGGMAVFLNNEPTPTEYKHFNVKSVKNSDVDAMKEIIARRFAHPEWETPDLIVLDGGIPQLSIVSPSIPENVPVIALAKKKETIIFYDENHKTVSLNLPLNNPVLNLFRSLRDETHRLANSFHRKSKIQATILK